MRTHRESTSDSRSSSGSARSQLILLTPERDGVKVPSSTQVGRGTQHGSATPTEQHSYSPAVDERCWAMATRSGGGSNSETATRARLSSARLAWPSRSSTTHPSGRDDPKPVTLQRLV